VLFVGRLEPRKGFACLLQAFALLSRSLPEARLLVAGAYGEAERRRFAARAAALGAGRVTFLGPLSPAALARCYASAAVCCAPSLGGESFGIVLLEAMAAGRPVVCSDIPGYREVVQPERQGPLVPPGDQPALAAALYRLLTDPALRARLGAAGR
jgi:phosphatidylinositol alpha-mannosyltransferase